MTESRFSHAPMGKTSTSPDGKLAFEIFERPDFSILGVKLRAGEKVFSEPAAMATMTPGVRMKSGLRGGIGRSLGRLFGGESLLVNTYTAETDSEVTFAPGPAGDMFHYRLRGAGNLMLQRGAFVAHSEGVDLTGKWQGAKGFFSGQGLVLLKASGDGDVFFNAYGAIMEIDVVDGFVVDTGYVVAFEDTLGYKVSVLPGLRPGSKIKTFLFGGEGLVVDFDGRGKVWIQTRDVGPFLRWVNPFRPQKSRG